MRANQLQQIVDHACQMEDEAAQIFSQAQQRLLQQQQQLQQLYNFLNEYQQQYSALEQGMNIRRILDYQAFVSRINEGIEQARTLVSQCEKECESKRQQWLKLRARSKALQQIAEERRRSERQAEEWREQKEMDEFAARVSRSSL